MSESRYVPMNLQSGSKLRDSLPDQKLIIYHLWATAGNDAGCFEPDLSGWSGHLSLTVDSLKSALADFETRGIISSDHETGEIFILNWFRFHKFENGFRQNMLERAINKIQSKNLKKLVLAKKEEVGGGIGDSRLVPRNLMSGSKVWNCLPDQKLIIYHLWATASNDAGCFEPDLGGWSGHLSLTVDSLKSALADFEKRGIISSDHETGEIFINDWFRFHKFENGVRKNMLASAINKIQSQKLKKLVLAKKEEMDIKNGVIPEKTKAYVAKQSKVNKIKTACIPQAVQKLPAKKMVEISGVTCWYPEDWAKIEKAVEDFGGEAVKKAAEELAGQGIDPLPSRVLNILNGVSNAKNGTNYNTKNFVASGDEDYLNPPPFRS